MNIIIIILTNGNRSSVSGLLDYYIHFSELARLIWWSSVWISLDIHTLVDVLDMGTDNFVLWLTCLADKTICIIQQLIVLRLWGFGDLTYLIRSTMCELCLTFRSWLDCRICQVTNEHSGEWFNFGSKFKRILWSKLKSGIIGI